MKTPSVTACAAHLGLSRAAITDLENTGVIDRRAGIDAVRISYIRHLRSRPRADAAADAEFRRARAREIEVRTAERLGKYVAVEEFDAMVDGLCGIVRSELASLPARVARGDLGLRQRLEQEIYGTLHRLADAAERQAAAQHGRADLRSPQLSG